ncbi:MAG: orotidine-5'-phosphate decarboxylase [archaeon]
MNFIESLKNKSQENDSIVCMGLDPVLDKIPIKDNPENSIKKFYLDILDAHVAENTLPAIAKPNIAFYEQYGFEGLRALKEVIKRFQEEKIPVILDAKRGDIGKTSSAYAKAAFEFWGADAITVAPYMGSDSISPFSEWCKKGKGVYVLTRTSNKGAVDLQNLVSEGKPIYMKTAEKVAGGWYKEGIGAVVGATYPKELFEISTFFVNSNKKIPMLIPGVGSQGGSASDVVANLKTTNNPIWLHRINSSSELNYAYIKQNTDDFAGASVKALRQLNKEIGKIDF